MNAQIAYLRRRMNQLRARYNTQREFIGFVNKARGLLAPESYRGWLSKAFAELNRTRAMLKRVMKALAARLQVRRPVSFAKSRPVVRSMQARPVVAGHQAALA